MIPELATDDVWKPRTTSEEGKSVIVVTDHMKMTDLHLNLHPRQLSKMLQQTTSHWL
jgi:hypothetical protein